ncbi:MAG: type IV pilin N-terminal domain-containing protein [Thermoplasmata archaeon]|nr:type IV pilin N-terminal domain-containing protein [Thermoplasmata archaeon]MCI4359739.1 type IV pilin N-terminal domain-containing protein [Thermoplasmata archaeon]
MTISRWRRLSRSQTRSGVSGIIATILLLAITIIAVVVLATFRPSLNQPPPSIAYLVKGGLSEQAWSDPTDCTNTTQYAHCNSLPAMFVLINGYSPSFLKLSNLNLIFVCNGTDLINANLQSLEVIPGSGASPPVGSPTIGNCGTWVWGSGGGGFTGTFFNRLLYYQQFTPGVPGIAQGDVIVIFAHPATAFCDYNGNCPDDDYHGAPLWCFTVQGACSVSVTYSSGSTNDLVMSFSLYGLSRQ